MPLDPTALLEDSDQLRAKLSAMATLIDQQSSALASLQNEQDVLEAERDHFKAAYEKAERQRLDDVFQQLLRRQSGPKSERLDPEQFQLALENIEQDQATNATAAEEAAAGTPEESRRRKRAPAQRSLGHLPEHLPVDEIRIEPEDTHCPCCGGAMHEIDVETTKRLHITPMKMRMRATVRPKYGCRSCAEAVVQAPAPASIIPGGLPTEALLAHIAVAKYQDGQPLYRQCQIFARDGVTLDHQTAADWLGRVAWWLSPVWERLVADVLASPKLFVDDTYLPVLDKRVAAAKAKGKKATRTGYLWGLGRDDAPWQGERPPAVAYVYTEDRVYARAAEVLAGYTGVLQVDGWGGFKRLIGKEDAAKADVGPVTLAYCWAHGRRDIFDIHRATGSPVGAEVLRRISLLYRVEEAIRGQPPEVRRAVRQEQSRPVVEALKVYVEEQFGRVSGKMPLAKALRYLLNHWDGLCVFLDDGRVEIDSNSIERRHRVVATVRRNSLFAGSDAGAKSWAMFTSLIQTARLNDVDPVAWLTDVLERMASGAEGQRPRPPAAVELDGRARQRRRGHLILSDITPRPPSSRDTQRSATWGADDAYTTPTSASATNGCGRAPRGRSGKSSSGESVSGGYLGLPELTRAVFVDNPFPDIPGKTAYRTGDLGRIGDGGLLEYHGRVDGQVKVRGLRIDLGEIEHVMMKGVRGPCRGVGHDL